jgi:hypothetical protein
MFFFGLGMLLTLFDSVIELELCLMRGNFAFWQTRRDKSLASHFSLSSDRLLVGENTCWHWSCGREQGLFDDRVQWKEWQRSAPNGEEGQLKLHVS